MPSYSQFTQSHSVGATVVVTGFGCPEPRLTTITGRGTKDGLPIFHHSESRAWARPEDIAAIPPRMAALITGAYDNLKEYYPSVLTDGAKGAIYLAVLPAYVDNGNDQADYAVLRDAIEAEARRLEANQAKEQDDLGPSTAHQLLAESTGTAINEWIGCAGPNQKGAALTAWFVRRNEGHPDIYAVASGDAEAMTIELIAAEPDQKDAYAVICGIFAGRNQTIQPDIECGVVFQGEIGSASTCRM